MFDAGGWPRGIGAGLVLLAALLLPAVGEGCAVCLGPPSGGEPGPGLNGSVLFMLFMPFAVVGAVGGWIFWTRRRARAGRGAPGLNPSGWSCGEEGE